MRNTLNSIGVKPTSDLTPDQIHDKIQAHLRSKRSVLADRFAFLDAYQHTQETTDDFLVRLDNLRRALTYATSINPPTTVLISPTSPLLSMVSKMSNSGPSSSRFNYIPPSNR